jgi:hypothetical protein
MYQPDNNRYYKMEYRRCGKSEFNLPELSLGLWHNFSEVDVFSTFQKIVWRASHTVMHVASSTIDKLVDYFLNSPADGYHSTSSVETLKKQIAKNLELPGNK